MAIDRSRALERPLITARLRSDNTALLRVDNELQHITETSEGAALQSLVRLIQAEAERVSRPVRVTVTAQTGLSFLVVDTDGAIEEESFMPFEELPKPWPPPEDNAAEESQADNPGAHDDAPDEEFDEADLPPEAAAVGEPGSPGHTEQAHEPMGEAAGERGADGGGANDTADEPGTTESPAAGAPQTDPDASVPASTPFTARSSFIAAEPSGSPSAPLPAQTPAEIQSPEPEPAGSARRNGTTAVSTLRTAEPAAPAEEAKTRSSEQSRRDLLDAPSFLALPTITEPARQGFAGLLNHLGLRLPPGPSERAERNDVEEISRHRPAHRTISVINRKGGANKTPTVVNLAAVFARYGGGGVLAWDNNETMGTLGWRTEQGEHDSTVLDVLASADDLLDARAEFGQMSKFVHHQQADKFDVLRSDEDVSGTHEMTADEVDVVHSIAAKYYRLIFMDSGNSDRAENWLRMLDHTDQLVVPTTTMEDRAQAALLTLQAVQSRSEKAAELARNAVVVVSEWQPKESSVSERMADDFRPFVRDVVIVPFDPALKAGRIQHSSLQPATRRAWLAAAAAVARGL
ncbi:chromosome partitioning protein [soil metagenome]